MVLNEISKDCLVRLLKNNRIYRVLHIARAAWDNEQLLVVYTDISYATTWVRAANEFCDGRFEFVNDPHQPSLLGEQENIEEQKIGI